MKCLVFFLLQELKQKITSSIQPATCNPIFKRFISKLLLEISRLGLVPNGMYDAKVHLYKTMAELQKLVVGETWTTGSLDDALSKILVDFKPHDYEAWKWRFEDTFGVELDTVVKNGFCRTWTLQDDPCKKYYEVLMVTPILLVSPIKAISVTITTFITEPLKHLGQGISEFLRALLKDLPVTFQILVFFAVFIPVVLSTVVMILYCIYGSAQTAIQHVLTGPLRRGRRDPPPPPNRLQDRGQHPQLEQGDSNEEDEDDQHHLGAGDAPLPIRGLDQRGRARGGGARGEGWRQEVRRRPVRPKENQRRVFVETLRNADHHFSGDETDQSRLPEEEIEREGEEREDVDVAEGDQAAAVAVKEVLKDVKRKEKEQPVDKKVHGIDSQHVEQGSQGERTMRPSDQQSTASTRSEGAAAPEQITSLQRLNVSI
ncbi:chloride channel CLIC-like protein 1 [Alosa alosa]|uniref:chloride channel CLIC-like protein 1 n=1 Tax=Alosa alosa TaxID=278164 RepID=UPI0020151317|nr:chloride channel CLIC-like protein 1 [Alosa alosa]